MMKLVYLLAAVFLLTSCSRFEENPISLKCRGSTHHYQFNKDWKTKTKFFENQGEIMVAINKNIVNLSGSGPAFFSRPQMKVCSNGNIIKFQPNCKGANVDKTSDPYTEYEQFGDYDQTEKKLHLTRKESTYSFNEKSNKYELIYELSNLADMQCVEIPVQ